MKKGQKNIAEATGNLLALKNVPTRMVRGIKLEENKKSFTPDLMLEAYTEGRWTLYDLKTGKKACRKISWSFSAAEIPCWTSKEATTRWSNIRF